MEFGRYNNPKDIDFSLLPWTFVYPTSNINHEKIFFYLGSTSWHQPQWSGVLWPSGKLKGKELQQYQTAFNSIEFNSSFYGIPTQTQIQKWLDQVEQDFRFALKVPQRISQASDYNSVKHLWDDFLSAAHLFGTNAGLLFWQFPSRLSNDNWKSKLYKWLPYIPNDIHLAFEIRNPAAYTPIEINEWSKWLEGRNVSIVITDTPGVREIIHNCIFSQKLMIRFVSCGDLSLDKLRLDQWLVKFKSLEKHLLREIYFFIHDHDSYRLPELVLYLSDKIFKGNRFIGRGPTLFNEADTQLSLF